MKASKTGEFALIDRIISEINKVKPGEWNSLVSGIGDDAAVIRSRSRYQVATTDCLVENVHFKKSFLDWNALGWKALAINLSDIAAMGGLPKYAVVSLAIPLNTDVEDVVRLYKGMLEAASESGTVIAGGNISRASEIAVHAAVIGEVPARGKVLLRSKAKKGDLIAVTGRLGAAAAGLRTLGGSLHPSRNDADILEKAFWYPQPRIDVGRILVKSGIHCGMDISDGLVADLGHILEMSRVGARIEAARVPVHPSVAVLGFEGLKLALTSGEDYELLFTGKKEAIEKVAAEACCPITIIGEITRGAGKLDVLDNDGKNIPFENGGWHHF
ncbi:thiamine-phosphate kinase [Dehalogenimonas etheniformans]|uniref:Thiamine-monophosphate kinase n=1 Tax=Dehalogenimonas etheniformans TaxID=1536648 RepID=A0A2P5P4Y1_9CHLR|nr:thiamine-phosphate kinase [Dehalogenimonas etheniformans]PPD57350.1 thiamine-phosphate kinase [Dehalogenimonas etheniformans]QNT75200.1 thiamine-phosphate kinase [Dehalogenimonas etheniformans]